MKSAFELAKSCDTARAFGMQEQHDRRQYSACCDLGVGWPLRNGNAFLTWRIAICGDCHPTSNECYSPNSECKFGESSQLSWVVICHFKTRVTTKAALCLNDGTTKAHFEWHLQHRLRCMVSSAPYKRHDHSQGVLPQLQECIRLTSRV